MFSDLMQLKVSLLHSVWPVYLRCVYLHTRTSRGAHIARATARCVCCARALILLTMRVVRQRRCGIQTMPQAALETRSSGTARRHTTVPPRTSIRSPGTTELTSGARPSPRGPAGQTRSRWGTHRHTRALACFPLTTSLTLTTASRMAVCLLVCALVCVSVCVRARTRRLLAPLCAQFGV